MASAAAAEPTVLSLGLRSGDAGGGRAAAPAMNNAAEFPAVDLAIHPSGLVPTLQ